MNRDEKVQLGQDLLEAARDGNSDRLNQCLEKGADTSHRGLVGNRNYWYRYENGMTALHYAAANNHMEILRILIDNGCDTNLQDDSGHGAIHYAAVKNNSDVLMTLIENGCEKNLQNHCRRTALHFAVYENYMDITKILIEKGCDTNLHDIREQTALHYAAEHNNMEILRILIDSGCDKNLQDMYGNTALHLAVKHNHIRILRILIEYGCDKNLQDMSGYTPLHCAAGHNYLKLSQMLIDNGCAINLKDSQGNTALHIAAEINNQDTVSYLLKRGLDRNILNDNGKKPIDVARNRKTMLIFKDFEKNLVPDFSLEELTFNRSILQGGNLEKRSLKLRDETETNQHILDINDMPLSTCMETLISETETFLASGATARCADLDDLSSSETFVTKCGHATLRSENHFQPEQVDVGNQVKYISEHLSDNESESKELKQNRIGMCDAGLRDSNSISSRIASDISLDDSKTVDFSNKRDKQRKQENPNRNDSMDFVDNNYSWIESIDEDIWFNIPCYFHSYSCFSDDQHIQTVTKPGIITRLKNFFGVSNKISEIKVSVTKDKFLEKPSRIGKEQLHKRKIAPIIIWDFGGQDIIYSTHQTFLEYTADALCQLHNLEEMADLKCFEYIHNIVR